MNKICKIHGSLKTEEIIEERCSWKIKNGEVKRGINYRCIFCRRDKDRKYKLNNPDKHKATASRARNEARRLYREGLSNEKSKADIWTENDRKNNPEKYKKWSKNSREKQGQFRNTKEVCRRFDISVDRYYEMLNYQKNKCAICNREERRKSRTDGKICALAIDHCHKTGKVRQLLCHGCNTAIGKFEDNIEYLKSAIMYLEKHNYTE